MSLHNDNKSLKTENTREHKTSPEIILLSFDKYRSRILSNNKSLSVANNNLKIADSYKNKWSRSKSIPVALEQERQSITEEPVVMQERKEANLNSSVLCVNKEQQNKVKHHTTTSTINNKKNNHDELQKELQERKQARRRRWEKEERIDNNLSCNDRQKNDAKFEKEELQIDNTHSHLLQQPTMDAIIKNEVSTEKGKIETHKKTEISKECNIELHSESNKEALVENTEMRERSKHKSKEHRKHSRHSHHKRHRRHRSNTSRNDGNGEKAKKSNYDKNNNDNNNINSSSNKSVSNCSNSDTASESNSNNKSVNSLIKTNINNDINAESNINCNDNNLIVATNSKRNKEREKGAKKEDNIKFDKKQSEKYVNNLSSSSSEFDDLSASSPLSSSSPPQYSPPSKNTRSHHRRKHTSKLCEEFQRKEEKEEKEEEEYEESQKQQSREHKHRRQREHLRRKEERSRLRQEEARNVHDGQETRETRVLESKKLLPPIRKRRAESLDLRAAENVIVMLNHWNNTSIKKEADIINKECAKQISHNISNNNNYYNNKNDEMQNVNSKKITISGSSNSGSNSKLYREEKEEIKHQQIQEELIVNNNHNEISEQKHLCEDNVEENSTTHEIKQKEEQKEEMLESEAESSETNLPTPPPWPCGLRVRSTESLSSKDKLTSQVKGEHERTASNSCEEVIIELSQEENIQQEETETNAKDDNKSCCELVEKESKEPTVWVANKLIPAPSVKIERPEDSNSNTNKERYDSDSVDTFVNHKETNSLSATKEEDSSEIDTQLSNDKHKEEYSSECDISTTTLAKANDILSSLDRFMSEEIATPLCTGHSALGKHHFTSCVERQQIPSKRFSFQEPTQRAIPHRNRSLRMSELIEESEIKEPPAWLCEINRNIDCNKAKQTKQNEQEQEQEEHREEYQNNNVTSVTETEMKEQEENWEEQQEQSEFVEEKNLKQYEKYATSKTEREHDLCNTEQIESFSELNNNNNESDEIKGNNYENGNIYSNAKEVNIVEERQREEKESREPISLEESETDNIPPWITTKVNVISNVKVSENESNRNYNHANSFKQEDCERKCDNRNQETSEYQPEERKSKVAHRYQVSTNSMYSTGTSFNRENDHRCYSINSTENNLVSILQRQSSLTPMSQRRGYSLSNTRTNSIFTVPSISMEASFASFVQRIQNGEVSFTESDQSTMYDERRNKRRNSSNNCNSNYRQIDWANTHNSDRYNSVISDNKNINNNRHYRTSSIVEEDDDDENENDDDDDDDEKSIREIVRPHELVSLSMEDSPVESENNNLLNIFASKSLKQDETVVQCPERALPQWLTFTLPNASSPQPAPPSPAVLPSTKPLSLQNEYTSQGKEHITSSLSSSESEEEEEEEYLLRKEELTECQLLHKDHHANEAITIPGLFSSSIVCNKKANAGIFSVTATNSNNEINKIHSTNYPTNHVEDYRRSKSAFTDISLSSMDLCKLPIVRPVLLDPTMRGGTRAYVSETKPSCAITATTTTISTNNTAIIDNGKIEIHDNKNEEQRKMANECYGNSDVNVNNEYNAEESKSSESNDCRAGNNNEAIMQKNENVYIQQEDHDKQENVLLPIITSTSATLSSLVNEFVSKVEEDQKSEGSENTLWETKTPPNRPFTGAFKSLEADELSELLYPRKSYNSHAISVHHVKEKEQRDYVNHNSQVKNNNNIKSSSYVKENVTHATNSFPWAIVKNVDAISENSNINNTTSKKISDALDNKNIIFSKIESELENYNHFDRENWHVEEVGKLEYCRNGNDNTHLSSSVNVDNSNTCNNNKSINDKCNKEESNTSCERETWEYEPEIIEQEECFYNTQIMASFESFFSNELEEIHSNKIESYENECIKDSNLEKNKNARHVTNEQQESKISVLRHVSDVKLDPEITFVQDEHV